MEGKSARRRFTREFKIEGADGLGKAGKNGCPIEKPPGECGE